MMHPDLRDAMLCTDTCWKKNHLIEWKNTYVFNNVNKEVLQRSNLLSSLICLNPLMPSGMFNICCPRDAVSRTANEKLVTIVANGH